MQGLRRLDAEPCRVSETASATVTENGEKQTQPRHVEPMVIPDATLP